MDLKKHLSIWDEARALTTRPEAIRYAALAAADALEALAKRIEGCGHDQRDRDAIVSFIRARHIPDWLSVAKYAEQYRQEVAWEACAAVASAPYGVVVDRGGYRSSAAARYLKLARGQISTTTRAGG